MRAIRRYAGATPWTRAVWLLWRRPSVVVALAGTAAILALTAATTPLFVASAGNAALHHQLDASCPASVGGYIRAQIPATTAAADQPLLFERRRAAVLAAAEAVGHRGELIASEHVRLDARRSDGSRLLQTLLTRDGSAAHIDVVERWAPAGVWLSDTAVAELGLRRGQTFTVVNDLSGPDRVLRPVELSLPIAGVYRDIAKSPIAPFWCGLRPVIYPPSIGSDVPTPSVALLDRVQFRSVVARLLPGNVTQQFELPLETRGLSVTAARQTAREIVQWRRALDASEWFDPNGSVRASGGDLGHVVERVDLVRASLRSTVGPVTVAGVLVALLLVAAAGSFWAERRREEVALLVARGVGPGALTVKALLEMIPALLLGGVGGWAAAVGLVRALGPSTLIGSRSVVLAAAAVGGALLLGLGLLAGVAASRFRAESERRRGHRSSRLLLVPWELGVLAVAGVLLGRLVRGGAQAGVDGGPVGSVSQIDPLLIAFPLLLLAGGVALGLRVLFGALGRLGGGGASWSSARYLAARRVAADRGVALLLAAAAALPVGVLVYSASMTATVEATVDAKVHVFTGSDVVAQVVTPGVPAVLAGHATAVARLDKATLGGLEVDVLGVDPTTFATGAYWNSRFSSTPLDTLVSRLGPTAGDGVTAVLLSGRRPTDDVAELEIPGFDAGEMRQLPVRISGVARHLPGEANGRPVLYIDRRVLTANTDSVFHQVWIRGDPDRAVRDLAGSDAPVVYVQRAAVVLDASSYLPVTYAFELLRALAVLTGAIGAGGLLLYLETRTRSRRVAYVLARRMGLTRLGHLRSLGLEIGGLLAVGLVLGGLLAVASSLGAYRRLDLDPYVPPSPLLVVPPGPIALVVVGTGLLGGLACLAAQRSADRATPAEVLRDAT